MRCSWVLGVWCACGLLVSGFLTLCARLLQCSFCCLLSGLLVLMWWGFGCFVWPGGCGLCADAGFGFGLLVVSGVFIGLRGGLGVGAAVFPGILVFCGLV